MIQQGNLVLRPVEDDDVPAIARWMNNPQVAHWMDYYRPSSVAEVSRDVEQARDEGIPLIIQVDRVPIGRIGLNRFRVRDGIAATYLYIGEDAYRGQGHGTRAMRLLLGYAFDTLNMRMVELWALAHNTAALALYKQAGFREDGRLRARSFRASAAGEGGEGGEPGYVDNVWMSVTQDEWRTLGSS